MQCPVDQTVLQMSERSGIEIDYCPTCRGVWLDRGELDKILDRAADQLPPTAPPADPQPGYDPGYRPAGYDPRYQQPSYDDQRYRQQSGYDPRYHKKRKKKSFLDELFD